MSKIWCFLKVAWWLYVGRLLVGCGIGLLSYVVNFVTVRGVRWLGGGVNLYV